MDRWTTSYTAAFANNGVQKGNRSDHRIFADEMTHTNRTLPHRSMNTSAIPHFSEGIHCENVIYHPSTNPSLHETGCLSQRPAQLVISEPVSVHGKIRHTGTSSGAIMDPHNARAHRSSPQSSKGATSYRCKNAPHPSDYRNFAADETTPHRSVVEHLRAAQRNGFDTKTLDALRQADPLVHRQLMEILTHRAAGLRSSDIRELQDQLALRCMARRQQLARLRAVREICIRSAKEKEIDNAPRTGARHVSRMTADTRAAATTRKPPFAHYGVGNDTYHTHNVRSYTGVRAAARKSARLRLRLRADADANTEAGISGSAV